MFFCLLHREFRDVTLRLADAFHVERDGVHRLLKLLEARIGQLHIRHLVPACP